MISAKMVKELREKTGAGMMDCKKALTETNGDMEKAVEFLRSSNQVNYFSFCFWGASSLELTCRTNFQDTLLVKPSFSLCSSFPHRMP